VKSVITVIMVCAMLVGCSGLSMLPDSAISAIANAGGGCVKATGIWGSGIVIIGSADKGVIRNGELTVAGDCGGIMIKESTAPRVAPLPPGTITTITIPAITTTTVTPAKP
jgi:hypothetical protein